MDKFKSLVKNGFKEVIDSRLNSSHPKRDFYKNLILQMPDLDANLLSDPQKLVDYGIWSKIP